MGWGECLLREKEKERERERRRREWEGKCLEPGWGLGGDRQIKFDFFLFFNECLYETNCTQRMKERNTFHTQRSQTPL